jgi:hypothetical protein
MQLSRRRRRSAPRKRPPAYYRVDGLDLRQELERLCALPVFGGPDGPLARRHPQLTVRRASKRPRRNLGFAIPSERRISVTAYPGIRRGDLQETLLHELVHIAVGNNGGSWHGQAFKRTLKRAMREGYGITGVAARGSIHGAYAEALERLSPGQLALDLGT